MPSLPNAIEPDILVSCFALFVSIAALTYTVYKGRYDQRIAIKPVLVFVYDREIGWLVHNIGQGPALNVLVATGDPTPGGEVGEWCSPTRIPPLRRDGTFALHWLRHQNVYALGATCEDMWDRPYCTRCVHDLNTVEPGRLQVRRGEEVVQEWTLRKSVCTGETTPAT